MTRRARWSIHDDLKAAQRRVSAATGEVVGVVVRGDRVAVTLPPPPKVGHRYRVVVAEGAMAVVTCEAGETPYLIRGGEEWVFMALVDALAQRAAKRAGLALGAAPLAWVVAVSPVRR